MPPDWRIYYADGSTFDNTRGNPITAPRFGVQVILVRDGRKSRRVLKLADYYVWRPSLRRWTDHEDATSAILAVVNEPWAVMLCGQYMREAEFEAILIKAHNDPDFQGRASEAPHTAWGE